MQRIYTIKSSQTWTCPKSGAWRIICVGGGSSGGLMISNNGTSLVINNGGTTSFGSILSASGGISTIKDDTLMSSTGAFFVGGFGGYNGINYGGIPQSLFNYTNTDSIFVSNGTLNGGHYKTQGIGFGAGGASARTGIKTIREINGVDSDGSITAFPLPGICGEMEMTIYDINQGTAVSCTIGQGGVIPIYNNAINSILTAMGFKGYPASVNGKNLSTSISAGKNGVIHLEYLG